MYEYRRRLTRCVRFVTRVAWKLYGRDPNALLWNIVERWPMRAVFGRMIPTHVPYILYEYPKCGLTWVRYMICQAEACVYPDVPLEDAIRDVQYPRHDLPRIRCTHEYIFTGAARKRGFIFLVRQPERVMVSNYKHTRYRLKQHDMELHEFIRSDEFGVKHYVTFVENAVREVRKRRHIIVKYEDLRASPVDQLERMLEFIELPLPREHVEAIVANSTLEKMREVENEGRYRVEWLRPVKDEKARRVGSGGKETLEKLFSAEELAFMREAYASSPVFAELGY